MALTATIYRFDLDISDIDRGVYDRAEIRVAMHPSETTSYLVARVLAWALSHQEGLAFSKGGLSQTDDPPLYVEDLTGQRTHWIDIGHPSADRLHKATKTAEHVAVYVHKPLSPWVESLSGKGIHRADAIDVVALPLELVDTLARKVTRNGAWTIVRTEGVLYVTVDGEPFEGALQHVRIEA
jgi:uncharacterized protein YaeQ